MTKPSKGIQSVEVGGQLLLALGAHGAPMMLRDLAHAAGMPAAKAHPYLVSFGSIGLVEQDPASGRYRLGALALRLGLASLQQSEPVRLATGALAELREQMPHTLTITVWSSRGPRIVRIDEADRPLQANLRIGTVMSTVATATGRVFAAFLPPERIRHSLEQERQRLAALDDRVHGAAERFEAELADIRRRGVARSVSAPLPGISAFSVPVFDRAGMLALAITATGAQPGFDATWKSPVARVLLEAGKRLSARLGHAPPEVGVAHAMNAADFADATDVMAASDTASPVRTADTMGVSGATNAADLADVIDAVAATDVADAANAVTATATATEPDRPARPRQRA